MAMPHRKVAKTQFVDFLQGQKLRLTPQRRAIIDTVFGTGEHFTAVQLLKWSRRRDKSVSRATVYRTLPLLTASGLVREMDFGRDYKFYDPNYADHPDHSHIICQDCDTIVEFDSEQIKKMEGEMCRKLGFSVKTHRLQITGSCEELKRLGKCARKKGH
ncbi:MAG: transcriptional repressor [Verrucomicrobiota bacterium]|jgi:Fur family ferric uptake transcriptional regulator